MKITTVIPSRNQAEFLAETLESVLGQEGGAGQEVIVVDGASTDGTLDLLRSVSDPRLAWTSEPDRGQAHAINKGLARATGDVVSWLNSDDLLEPGALRSVAAALDAHPEAGWLVGRCLIVDRGGDEIRRAITRYRDRRLRRYSYRALLRENFLPQMSVFWRRSLGERTGALDESLHYTMDYDYWLRLGASGDPLILDRVLSRFRYHRGSKSGAVDRRQFDEEYEVACRYLGSDRLSRTIHALHVAKTVWAYRLMRLVGM